MKIIAAVDNKWAIGKSGKLLVVSTGGYEILREETAGKVVIMGRKTLENLKETDRTFRKNSIIVITSNKNYSVKNAIVCHSIEEALKEASKYDTNDVYVIGGGMIYEQMLDLCDEAHITKIDYTYDADTYFPNLDNNDKWKIAATSDEKTYFNICYEFIKYVKI